MSGIDALIQDYIMLGGEKSPGKATVSGAGSPRKWDIRNGYGWSGASVFYMGDSVSQFEVTIELWEASQLPEWERFSKRVLEKMPVGKRPKALGIAHPQLNMSPLNITAVVVEDVSQLEQDEFGLWTVTIKLLQYRAPLPMLGKPKQTIPAAAKPVPTAQDKNEEKMQKLMVVFDEESVR